MRDDSKLIQSADYNRKPGAKSVKTVNPPLYTGSTVLFDSYEDLMLANSGEYDGITYGTDRLPTQRAFEEALKNIENGYLTRAFQSGISAITNTLLAFTVSGDHILVCQNVYGPTAHFCQKILTKYNINVTFVPPAVGTDIDEYIEKNTRLVFLESPGSNTFEIQDIPSITQLARAKGIITVLDNTWATPLYLKPFDLGLDISIQSVTKYIAGHSDLLLGAVTVNEKCSEVFAEYYKVMEIFASPHDCYLALRGLTTLPVRLKQHEASALQIANWLETVEVVDRVIHPALPGHPQHRIWRRDFSGSSGLFAFTFKENYSSEQIASFINSLEFFGIGYSWGGFKSLITAGKFSRTAESEYCGKNMIRLNIGLEDSEDLMQDLARGFDILK
ncbi:MAG: cystathionine beta-lyase [bacterium]|nr:cystathionine beta-lyase [bacterium]